METDRELRETWDELGIDPEGLSAAPDGTIRADAHAETRPSDDLLRTLGAIPSDEIELEPLPRLSSEQVELGPVLGEGGTGRVWVALQRSLKRQVAVKGLRDEVDGPIARLQLLREARVTGRLEHPNVVPVHVLVRDEAGAPRMVMKRVEGRSWGELLWEDRREGGPLGAGPLERHLRILIQVCHAVHYAHSRGVLHRDLKPDNVMVGEYGEVYVVDWGIAVALEADETLPELPLAKDVRGIVGTLPYMAPEMVGGDGRELGVHSDVFLLGAILHELITGTLRHQGSKLPELVHAAWICKPAAYEGVPDELATIARRATARDPKRRHPSAEALRIELEAFLTHRHASMLVDEGAERLADAQALGVGSDEALRALQEARFAYRQALRIWPESRAAREGLEALLELWMEGALAARDIGTARLLLTDMGEAEAARWRGEIETLGRELSSRDQKLAALEAKAAEADLGAAAFKRRGFGIAFAIVFFLANGALHFVDEATGLGHVGYLAVTGAVAAGFGLPALLFHRHLFPNEASRRLGWSLGFLLLGQVFTFTALWLVEVPLRPSLTVSLFSLAAILAVKSAMVDWRMYWSAVLSACFGGLALVFPSLVFFLVGGAYGAFFAGGALLSYEEKLAAEQERRDAQ